MSLKKKTYWKGIEELKNDTDFIKKSQNEFPEYLPIKGSMENSRRDFLKMMGFGIAAASVAACEAPVRKAIPYVNKPVEIDPSIPNYYASSYSMGSDYCSVVVKTREGRPIKIEGNTLSTVSGGGTTAQVESSILTLYDKERLKEPMLDSKETDWKNIDDYVLGKLEKIKSSGKKVYVLSNSISSPSSQNIIDDFIYNYNGTHVEYDQLSYHGMLEANNSSFGIRKLPFYDFSKAKIIVSFGYDFLGSSFNNSLFNKQFAKSRRVNRNQKKMSRLYSFESNLTITGANADYRIPIKSLESPKYITKLYNVLADKTGKTKIILGTRSAIWTPLKNPGIYIIDEEHDLSYKQQSGFQYSARDLLVVRAKRDNVPALLGSATPSLETIFNANKNRYIHLILPTRAGAAKPPKFCNTWGVNVCFTLSLIKETALFPASISTPAVL